MPKLTTKIDKIEEKEFVIESNEFFRPDLKQVGNSIFEIRNHFCNGDEGHICVVPETAEVNFKDIYNDLLFLMEKSQLFCDPHDSSDESVTLKGGLLFISASLAPVFNICSVTIPDSLQCDLLLLVPHHPMTVLSVLKGDSKSEDAEKYNVAMARGVTVGLAKFMDECVSPLCGILDAAVLKNHKVFETKIESFRKCSSLFVTPKSLFMTSAKYDKALTAFWAAAAETTSVKGDGNDGDHECLRFLTKDQCIVLIDNIDKKEVLVEYHPQCGGSTLMLEIAKRLSTVGETVMVCDTDDKNERIWSNRLSVKAHADLSAINNNTIQHVVYGNGELPFVPDGRVWRFVKTRYTDSPYEKTGIKEADYQKTESKSEHPQIEKLSTSEMLKGYLKTTGRERIHNFLYKLAEPKQDIFCTEKFPFDDLEKEVVSMMLQAVTLQFHAKDLSRLKTSSPDDLEAFKARISKDRRDEIHEETCGSLYQTTELKKALEEDPEIFHNIRQEVLADKKTISYLEAKVAYLRNVPSLTVHLQRDKDSEQDNWESEKFQEHVGSFLRDNTLKDEVSHNDCKHHTHQLRQYQHGTLKQDDILAALRYVIHEEKKIMSLLHAESKSLEEAFGCPVHIVGEVGSLNSRPLSCPPLDFNKDRVNTGVAHISEDDELINVPTESTHQGGFRFHRYRGTCTLTSIPIPSRHTRFPPCPQYWETRVRGLVKRDVPVWRILFETGVSEKSQMDTKYMESAQLRSWCFVLADCGMHEGICTKIWGEGKLIKCIRNTMTNAPNSYNVHNYGTVLDVWRGRLAFIDLKSENVLHKFDIDFKEELYPMCGVWLYPEDYLVGMKLVSGSQIVMTPEKISLIHRALYTHDEQ